MSVSRVTVIVEKEDGSEVRVETEGLVLDFAADFEAIRESPGHYPIWGPHIPPETVEGVLSFKIKLLRAERGAMYLVTSKGPSESTGGKHS